MRYLFIVLLIAVSNLAVAQDVVNLCSNNPARAWWDVQQYDLSLRIDVDKASVQGKCIITAKVVKTDIDSLQIDLASPLVIDSILIFGKAVNYAKQDDAYFLKANFAKLAIDTTFDFTVYYHGQPRLAKNAPWDAGFILKKDANDNPWMAVTCQGFGAHAWFPCKSFTGDEPARVITRFEVPENLSAIGNGKLLSATPSSKKHFNVWTWQVVNPINNYDITFYIGDYTHWRDTFHGKDGQLSLDYYVLKENLKKAKQQFSVVKPMLQCFEDKLGPYPFYKDGFKLVDAPYLGMEHQSAVAYGNKYLMGYLGKDLSNTGVGLLFDFIIVHESAHEWFGNSITAADVADTWIQEGFTSYCETIFAECLFGKEKAFTYMHGMRDRIKNDRPSQGASEQCDGGSGDHYVKGAFVVHMIRTLMQDDRKFYDMLREMNTTFYHQLVTSQQIETFINRYSGIDFSKLFDQYLRQQNFPTLAVKKNGKQLQYRWERCVAGFQMPLKLEDNTWIYPTTNWQNYNRNTMSKPSPDFIVDVNK